MTTTKLDIRPVQDWRALYCHCPRQTQQQGCYIELDCQSGVMVADYNSEIGNAVPFSVWHGHDRRYGIPCLTADAANELMEELAPLAQRVIDGYSSEWDGNNHVARLTDDASAAEEEIEAEIEAISVDETNGVSGWDAEEWLCGGEVEGLTAATTDEELAALAAALESEAAESNIVLRGTEEYLARLRDEMRDDQDEDEDE